MKKQNRNGYAYVRQPNVQNNDDALLGSKTMKQSPKSGIFNQVINEMDHNLTKYISKLVNKSQKEEQKRKSLQKQVNHERTKSYANILVQTPTSAKTPTQKGHSHRGSHPATQINNIFFSLNNSPTNQKKPTQFKILEKPVQKNPKNNSFLLQLDGYINSLSMGTTMPSMKKTHIISQQPIIGRASHQKNKDSKSSTGFKYHQQNQQQIPRSQKQRLRVANSILLSEVDKLNEKLKKYKYSSQRILEYSKELQKQLKIERREKRRLEQFLADLQERWPRLKPQRRTSGPRLKLKQFLAVSQDSTLQDDSEVQYDGEQTRGRSMNRRKAVPRGTIKNSRLSGLNYQQISAMLASKNHQYVDNDDDNSSQY